jgi:hypothetical protein
MEELALELVWELELVLGLEPLHRMVDSPVSLWRNSNHSRCFHHRLRVPWRQGLGPKDNCNQLSSHNLSKHSNRRIDL